MNVIALIFLLNHWWLDSCEEERLLRKVSNMDLILWVKQTCWFYDTNRLLHIRKYKNTKPIDYRTTIDRRDEKINCPNENSVFVKIPWAKPITKRKVRSCCCCCTNKTRGELARPWTLLLEQDAIKQWSVRWVHKRRLNLKNTHTHTHFVARQK